MKIAIASGKGGTGKTTLATNLALFLANQGNRTIYADCDVEEPNGHLFLKPNWDETRPVAVKIPRFDYDKCDFCGKCSDICRFNALAVLPDNVLLFQSLCHSCGGCFHICPQKAIDEVDRTIGTIRTGKSKDVIVYEGRLNVGEALVPPIIRQLKDIMVPADFTIIDSPPGTSCPVIEAVSGSDYVILVTEPTPFGLNDLSLAVSMIRALNLPLGVVINRQGIGDDRIYKFCDSQGIDILLEIPNDRRIAELCSDGKLLVNAFPEYIVLLENLMANLRSRLKATGA